MRFWNRLPYRVFSLGMRKGILGVKISWKKLRLRLRLIKVNLGKMARVVRKKL